MSRKPRQGTAEVETLSHATWSSAQKIGTSTSRKMFSSYCHRCRNALNGIKLALYLAKRAHGNVVSATWNEVEANYFVIEKYFDRLQKVYQPISPLAVKIDLGQWLAGREPDWQHTFSHKGRALVLDAPSEPVSGEFDPYQLGQALDGFIAWRATAGSHAGDARLAWGQDDHWLILEWQEEGREAIPESFDHAYPFDPQSTNENPSLALLLLKQVIAAHRGSFRCTIDQDFRVTLRWPKSQKSEHEPLHQRLSKA
jgi:hypothetical protein